VGKRIVITGGGTGIGRATAARMLPRAAEIVLVGRRREVLEEAAELEQGPDTGARIRVAPCDLVDPHQVAGLARDLRQGPTIDILVANAGGNHGHTAEPGDLEAVARAWRADFDGNVLTAVLLTEALLDHVTRPGGRIVATSSIAGLRGSGSYGAAKAAVNAWVWSLATQLAPEGITVNAVAPGFVPETPFWQERVAADPKVYASRVAPIPMGRPGTAAEVAAAIDYLASDDAGWTTGQILQVNGGTLLGRG
jgi:3-oxoacyl-[acyl-carrier protein] reductase